MYHFFVDVFDVDFYVAKRASQRAGTVGAGIEQPYSTRIEVVRIRSLFGSINGTGDSGRHSIW